MAAGLVAAVLIGLVVSTTQWIRAETSRKYVQRLLYYSNMVGARDAWERNDLARMHQLLERSKPKSDEEELRGFDWYYLWELCRPGITAPTFDHGSSVCGLSFSADGREVTAVSSTRITRRSVPTLDAIHDQQIDPTGIYQGSGRLSPDSMFVAYGHENGNVTLVELATEKRRTFKGHSEPVWSTAFSPNDELLATGDAGGTVILWHVATGESIGAT